MNDTTTSQEAPSKRVVRFLTSEFDAFVEPLGHTSNVKKAKFVGCGIATMSRIRAGKQNPGPKFIAAIYAATEHAPGRVTGDQFFDFHGTGSAAA